MRLQTKCKSCSEQFKIKSKAQSRPDLIDELGEYFRKRCEHCGFDSEYHVNDVNARDLGNIPGTIIGIVVIILITLFFWNEGWLTNIGFIIGVAVILASNTNSLTSNSKLFNKYYVEQNEKEDLNS